MLSPYEKGELSGYTLSKHGADILIPAGTAKLAISGTKSAKRLTNASRSLINAERALALETGLPIDSLATKAIKNTALPNKPPPLAGRVNPILPNNWTNDSLLGAALAKDKNGFTRAGRGLMKHGNREGSVFPKPKGNPAEMNARGKMFVEKILSDPAKQIYPGEKGSYYIFNRAGEGLHYNKKKKFVGFVEGQYEPRFKNRNSTK